MNQDTQSPGRFVAIDGDLTNVQWLSLGDAWVELFVQAMHHDPRTPEYQRLSAEMDAIAAEERALMAEDARA